MKARRLLGAIFVVVMALFVCAIQGVRVANDVWQARDQPLTSIEIYRDSQHQSREKDNASESGALRNIDTGDVNNMDTGIGSGRPGRSDNREAIEAVTSLSNSKNDTPTASAKLAELPALEIHLSSKPTREQIQKKFSCTVEETHKTETTIILFLSSTAYTLRGSPGIPYDVGKWSAYVGDFASARNYLRESVRVEPDAALRGQSCAMLAWLEDDPEISAALIEESLAAPENSGMDGWAPANALHLALVTGSDETAAAIWARYHDALVRYYPTFEIAREIFPHEEKQIAFSDSF
jgi:hypothetical protein